MSEDLVDWDDTEDVPSSDPSWAARADVVIDILETIGPATRSDIRRLDLKRSRGKRLGRQILDTLAWMSTYKRAFSVDGRWYLPKQFEALMAPPPLDKTPPSEIEAPELVEEDEEPDELEEPEELEEDEPEEKEEAVGTSSEVWVSSSEAANMLDCKPPHLKTLTDRGQLVRKGEGGRAGFVYRRDLVEKLVGTVGTLNGNRKVEPPEPSKALTVIPPEEPTESTNVQLAVDRVRAEGAEAVRTEYRQQEEAKKWQYLCDGIDDILRLVKDGTDRKLQSNTVLGGIAAAAREMLETIEELKSFRNP